MGIVTTIFVLLIFVALIPVIVISTLLIVRDKEKESVKTIVKYYALGLLSVVIANVFYAVFRLEPDPNMNFFLLFICVFAGISVIEELSKWISVKIGMIRDLEFNNMYDGIVFAVIVSLGFAGVENVLYVLSSIMEGFTSFYLVAVFRAFLAVPGHAIYGLFMGLFLEKAKICKLKEDDAGNVIYHGLSLFVPMLLHTIYDALLIYTTGNHSDSTILGMLFIFLIYVVIINVVSVIILIKASNKSEITFNSALPSYCSNCGSSIGSVNYCPSCGYKKL